MKPVYWIPYWVGREMPKSLHELKEQRIKRALGGLSYPMIYVRQAWYTDQNESSESYRGLQQLMRRYYPELVRKLTIPPWPHAAVELAEYWKSMGETDRNGVGSFHALLYLRLEWFTEYMLRKDNNTGLVDLDYERIHSDYRDVMRKLLQ